MQRAQAGVESVRRQLLQHVEPRDIGFPAPPLLCDPSFQSSLAAFFAASSLPDQYKVRVLKRLISLLSEALQCHAASGEEDAEIDSSLLELYTSLISSVGRPASAVDALEKVPVTYTFPPSPFSGREFCSPLVITESRNLISGHGTTGLRTWEAAMVLAEWLVLNHLSAIYKFPAALDACAARDNIYLPRESILELGAGTGLVSMVAARLGVPTVVASDGDSSVCDALRKNVKANGLQHTVSVRSILWGTSANLSCRPSLVLGADVTYDSSVIPHLVSELVSLFARYPEGMRVVITATIRNEDTFESFRSACKEKSLRMSETLWVPPEPAIFYYRRETPILVVKISK